MTCFAHLSCFHVILVETLFLFLFLFLFLRIACAVISMYSHRSS